MYFWLLYMYIIFFIGQYATKVRHMGFCQISLYFYCQFTKDNTLVYMQFFPLKLIRNV